MKLRTYRRHLLNGIWGEQELQEGPVSKIHTRCDEHVIFRVVVLHLPQASYAYKTIGFVTDVIEILC